MDETTRIDVPHTLGREEARRRLKARIGELPGHLPGGVATIDSRWPAEDRMALDIVAMGQRVAATLDVEDRVVRVSVMLPPMLRFMAGAIQSAIRQQGGRILLDDKRKV